MMSKAFQSSILRNMSLVALGALALALAIPPPGARAQDANEAAAAASGGAPASSGVDALDLEALLRLRSDPKNSYFIKGTSYSLDFSAETAAGTGGSMSGYPGLRESSTSTMDESFPLGRIDGSMAAIHDSPAPGMLLFAFRPVVANPDVNSVQPAIERIWAGLGGHHLVTPGSSGAFPVICRLRGGARPFRGYLQVSQDKSLRWTAPVTLDPGQESTVEVDVGGGSADVNGMNGDWQVTLRSNELGQAADRRTVHLGAGYARVFMITPSIGGRNTTDEAICVVKDLAQRGYSSVGSSAIFCRLEAVSPSVLPENEAGWDSAREVIVPADMERLLSPAVRSALMAWTLAGGKLVVFPGSDFIPSEVRDLRQGTFPASMPVGSGQIEVWAPRFANLDRPTGARWLYSDMDMVSGTSPDSALQSAPSATAPSITMPRWPVFVIFGLLYAAILGPLSLWLMRRVRRIVQVWLVLPLTASLLTVVILALSGTWTHALRTLNVSADAVIASGASDGFARSQLWLFTPEGGNLSFNTRGQAVQLADQDSGSPNEASDLGAVTDSLSGGVNTVQIQNLPTYGMRRLTLSGAVHLNGTLQINLRPDGSGTLTNATDKPLPASSLTTPNFQRSVPALAPGRRYHFPAEGWTRRAQSETFVPVEDLGVGDRVGAAGAKYGLPRSAGASQSARISPARRISDSRLHPAEVEWRIVDGPWGGITADRRAAGNRSCLLIVTAPTPPRFFDH